MHLCLFTLDLVVLKWYFVDFEPEVLSAADAEIFDDGLDPVEDVRDASDDEQSEERKKEVQEVEFELHSYVKRYAENYSSHF